MLITDCNKYFLGCSYCWMYTIFDCWAYWNHIGGKCSKCTQFANCHRPLSQIPIFGQLYVTRAHTFFIFSVHFPFLLLTLIWRLSDDSLEPTITTQVLWAIPTLQEIWGWKTAHPRCSHHNPLHDDYPLPLPPSPTLHQQPQQTSKPPSHNLTKDCHRLMDLGHLP